MNTKIEKIRDEIKKVITGKDEIIEKVIGAILAEGHILLEDMPGVGKTTLALAISKAMGLSFNRIQFTPDVVPSDITGFSMYDQKTGSFKYVEGAAMCSFLLADEINRTSSKTQSALLEVMSEGKVTVDGIAHKVPAPFVVVATQNPLGTAGTQMLPEAQLDRFMIQLSMGYPDFESQVEILMNREKTDPMEKVEQVICQDEIKEMIKDVKNIYVDRKIYVYITQLVEATRKDQYIKLGLSPRAALALAAMAKAKAYIEDEDYLTPEHIENVFKDIARHRIVLQPKARIDELSKDDILERILEENKAPKLD